MPTMSNGWYQLPFGPRRLEAHALHLRRDVRLREPVAPRCAGPRPSSRSSARKRMCARSRSGVIAAAAAFSAGVSVTAAGERRR